MKHHVHINLCGLTLPVAILRLRQCMLEMSPNQVVKAEMDQPETLKSMKVFVNMTNVGQVDHAFNEKHTFLLLRKSESYFGKM